MSRWPLKPSAPTLALGLSGTGCAFRVPAQSADSRYIAKRWPTAWAQLSADQVVTTLSALVARSQRPDIRSVQLMFAEELSRYWMLQPPTGTRSLTELQAVAQARGAQILGGLTGKGHIAGWHIEADWSASHEFLCAALPEALLRGVEQWLQQASLVAERRPSTSLLSLLTTHRAYVPRNGWLCVTWPDRTQLILFFQGRVKALRSLSPSAADSTRDRLRCVIEELRRERLRLAVAEGLPIRWIHSDSVAHEQPDRFGIDISGESFAVERVAQPHAPAETALPEDDLASRYAWLASPFRDTGRS